MTFTVLVDACVLVKAAVRDTILRVAESEQFDLRLAFSREILDEVRRTLVADLHVSPVDADHLTSAISDAFEDGLVEGYEGLIPAMQVHPKDRHVLAAAVRAEASVIVTDNTRDFPDEACALYDIQVQTPDLFLVVLWGLNARVMAGILVEQAAFLQNPPMTLNELLSNLEREVPTFVRLVRDSHLLPIDP